MSYLVNKAEVMEFFDNHIMKYIITDLEILNKIKADDSGIGGCAIPQALSTFSALDLMGYLLHPQDIETNKMTFSDLLKNSKYFPEFETFSTKDNFILSFKDNLRNIIALQDLGESQLTDGLTPIPDSVLAVLPDDIRMHVIAWCAICGLVSRFINQSKGVQSWSLKS